jgi:quinoprotein glucose dehydrogenase
MFHRHIHFGGGLTACLILSLVCLVRPVAGDPEGGAQNARAAAAATKAAWKPKIELASDEGELAISQFQLPEGFRADLFAAEPRMANPVAFCFDEKGRVFVAETYRLHHGVIDIREVMDWLDDDTACRVVGDRKVMVRKFRGDAGVKEMEVAAEQLRLVEDRDGDGKADHDSVFADGYNKFEDGIASGVLARGGDVYFANIPSLYLLRDKDGDGKADEQKELHYGYGVRFNFIGHDLHGLVFGPDGKLYFSIGDRALNIERSVDGRKPVNLDSGAVLRCNADGTELELVHTGLRNPQELAFDEYGNLFTGDNNCDAGDMARWVYVVEGGDSGWREGYQSQEFPTTRGPWMNESLWKPDTKTPGYYMLPPVANLKASGPSGLTYNPGTSMPAKYDRSFFLADFRGGASGSGIWQLTNQPKGATFEVTQSRFAGNMLPTDVDFGPGGGLYYSDWVAGWEVPGKGRIYHIYDPKALKDPVVEETKKLIADDFAKRAPEDLLKLLEHKDMRVRQKAQFALAARGAASVPPLAGVADQGRNQLARVHAIWALGQLARQSPDAMQKVLPLLSDRDPEIRAQATKVLGEAKVASALPTLLKLLADDSPRVRFFAAISLGKLGRHEAMPAILKMLEDNDDRDPYLRHAGVMAIAGIRDPDPLRTTTSQAKPSARMAVLLALRKLRSPDVAVFLNDPDPRIVLETARAINDEPIEPAMPNLAALITKTGLDELVLQRVINANYRVGTQQAADALAEFAARNDAPEFLRADALALLGEWKHVPGRNHITGNWNPLPDRDPQIAARAVEKVLPQLLQNAPDAVRVAAAGLAQKIGTDQSAVLLQLVGAKNVSPGVRGAALESLAGRNDPKLADAIRTALSDRDASVRLQAIKLQARLPNGADQLGRLLTTGSIPEQQAVLAALAAAPESNANADRIVSRALDRLLENKVAPEVRVDILDAAAKRGRSGEVQEKLKRYEEKLDKNDPLAEFRDALVGGDAEKGRKIFQERADLSCLRCHRINGEGGNAGPDLAGVGAKHPREYFLESILLPQKQIAQGWETVIVRLKNGDVVSGILKAETDTELRLELVDTNNPDAKPRPLTIAKKDIDKKRGGQSAMPEGLGKTLKKQDLRDLVEFLASLKDPPAGQANGAATKG